MAKTAPSNAVHLADRLGKVPQSAQALMADRYLEKHPHSHSAPRGMVGVAPMHGSAPARPGVPSTKKRNVKNHGPLEATLPSAKTQESRVEKKPKARKSRSQKKRIMKKKHLVKAADPASAQPSVAGEEKVKP